MFRKALVALGSIAAFASASSFPDAVNCDAKFEDYGTEIMDWTTPAVWSTDYSIRTGDGCLPSADPTTYEPNEYMTIHIRTLRAKRYYRGFMLYAINEAGNKVGSWDLGPEDTPTTDNFWLPPGGDCEGKTVMHKNGADKHYHHWFRFQAPAAGTGPITFHTLIKRGQANLGEFYWAGVQDLVLQESVNTDVWVKGAAGQTCSAVCQAAGQTCSDNFAPVLKGMTVPDEQYISEFAEALFNQIGSHTCQLPLLQGCGQMGQGPDDWCTFPGPKCPLLKCSDAAAADTEPFCACGPYVPPVVRAEECWETVERVLGAAPGNKAGALPLLLAGAAGLYQARSSRLALFTLGALAILAMAQPASAHNWVGSPARSFSEAATSKPCRQRFNESVPHYQVGPGQTFEIEWAQGHGDHFYFVVLKLEDLEKAKNHTKKLINDYIDNAPPGSDKLQGGERNKWVKVHMNRDNPHTAYTPQMFAKKLAATDPEYIPRNPRHQGNSRTEYTQWKYTDPMMAEDRRVEYTSLAYPWIIAVHKFKMSGLSRPSDYDTARFRVPLDAPSGKYIFQYMWQGYYDCIDVDYFPTAIPASETHGRPPTDGDNIWKKMDHCQFEEIQRVDGNCRQIVTTPDRCLADCKARDGCQGVNIIPARNPNSVFSNLASEVNIPCATASIASKQNQDLYMCYGLRGREPNNTHPQFTVTQDPESPVWYSTCYLKTADWVFDRLLVAGSPTPAAAAPTQQPTDVNATQPPPTMQTVLPDDLSPDQIKLTQSPWRYGSKCISCQDRKKSLFSDLFMQWKVSPLCEMCSDLDTNYQDEPAGDALSLGRCDGQTNADGFAEFYYDRAQIAGCPPLAQTRCQKELVFEGYSSVTAEECQALAALDPECSDTVSHRFDRGSRTTYCHCYSRNPCCGVCSPHVRNRDDYRWTTYNIQRGGKDSKGETPAGAGCTDGTKSSDGKRCCPASCGGVCAPEPVARVAFVPASGLVATPPGHLADTGATFGARNGLEYGWIGACPQSANILDVTWEQGRDISNTSNPFGMAWAVHPDKSATCTGGKAAWELTVPNGQYHVELFSASYSATADLSECTIEGMPIGGGTRGARQPKTTKFTALVGDGKLTIEGSTTSKCTHINTITVYERAAAEQSGLLDADTQCEDLPGVCCATYSASAARPCSTHPAPCTY